MPKVLLSLGSNIPPKKTHIQRAIAEIIKRKMGYVLMVAPYYKTDPVGKTDQDWFINTCILIETTYEPLDLLKGLQKIENDLGRIRTEKWGKRSIDIDIILFELSPDQQVFFKTHPQLTIPHPEMKNRAFVLRPMYELMPWLIFDDKPLLDLVLELEDQKITQLVNKVDIYEEIIDMYWDVNPRKVELGLDRIKLCLDLLGKPHLKLPPVIHIAGTNGKGSTAAIMHSLLSAMGKKVHRFTSPHLRSYSERFILGLDDGGRRFVSIEEFEIFAAQVAPLIKQSDLSHFEALTIMAILLFSQNIADYIILETGMGGRLDATNVIPNPIATIITTISKDHTAFLGNSIESIAFEKAGIIKENTPIITSVQFPKALEIIKQRAKELNAPLLCNGKDWSIVEIEEEEQNITIDSFIYKNTEIFLDLLSLQGSFQLENAGAALAALITILGEDNLPDPDIIDDGLSTVNWPARLEHLRPQDCNLPIDKNVEFIVDSAHNAEGLFALTDYLTSLNEDKIKETYLIISFKKERDLLDAFSVLSEFPAQYIFIKSHLAHEQCTLDALTEAAENFNLNYEIVENWHFLVGLFQDPDIATKRYVVTGSIYFISTFYQMIDYQIKP
ncbi:MAG: dihydrofolate synthase/folylpolyglutamate synthase [Alphaproteobacteria bacterium]|jgi:dihydrofolate synthase/folylpolyglutamate synthase